MVIAETDRLLLAKVTLDDAPFFVELMNSPHWIKYIGDRNIKTEEDAKSHLKKTILKSYAENGYGFFKVLLKSEENKIIGICGLVKREELELPDIGFGFLPEYEGMGFGYESASSVLQLAENKYHIDQIGAICMAENKNSIRLIEKLGMNYQKKVNPFDEDEELLLFVKKLN